PLTSRTSPVNIEGITDHFEGVSIDSEGTPITAVASINGGFYADIPLPEDRPRELTVTFQSGAVEETAEVEWIATNLFDHEELHIRQGDELLLDAWTGSATGTFTVEIDS